MCETITTSKEDVTITLKDYHDLLRDTFGFVSALLNKNENEGTLITISKEEYFSLIFHEEYLKEIVIQKLNGDAVQEWGMEDNFLKVASSMFCCKKCGSNMFRRHLTQTARYRCNGCGEKYTATRGGYQ